jgi:hypothetical protein
MSSAIVEQNQEFNWVGRGFGVACAYIRLRSLEATPTSNTARTSSMASQIWIQAALQLSVIFFCYNLHLGAVNGIKLVATDCAE